MISVITGTPRFFQLSCTEIETEISGEIEMASPEHSWNWQEYWTKGWKIEGISCHLTPEWLCKNKSIMMMKRVMRNDTDDKKR